MTDLSPAPERRPPAPPRAPTVMVRRGDTCIVGGVALVVLLLLASFFVVSRDGPSDSAEQALPYLPFAGAAPDGPPPAEVAQPIVLLDAAPGTAADSVAPDGPRFVTVVGTLQVDASAPSDFAGPRPGCDLAWAPRLQILDPTGAGVVTATLAQPGVLYGPIDSGGRTSWNCTYRYRAGFALDAPTYVFHASAASSGGGSRHVSANELTSGQGPVVSLGICARCGYYADED